MGRSRRGIGALVVLVSFLGALAPTGASAAAPAERPAAPIDPLVVDRPRFEPLGDVPLEVAGAGAFRGAIEVTRTGGGVSVINHVALDDYLRGISEVPVSWPLEAQKAQAVAARTYALYEVGRTANAAYKAAGADICATDACQVYAGVAKERRPGSAAWNAAVTETSGQVLVHKGRPIVAKYSSSNGGRSVNGGQPYLRATDDPDDRYSPLHLWTTTYPLSEVVRVAGFGPDTVDVRREGDVVVATSIDAAGVPAEQHLPADEFRRRVNGSLPRAEGLPSALPSIRYEVRTGDGAVHIVGRGWGHGIGLSQYGALGKALRGLRAPDILAAYYGGLRPVSVPADRLPQAVRVALSLDRPEAAVGAPGGHFRIVDGAGRVVAHRAEGSWSAAPAPGGRVRLLPPPDQAVPPSASIAAVEPAVPAPGGPLTLRLELAGPAAVTRLSLVAPDGTGFEVDPPKLRAGGPVEVQLGGAATATAGTYRLDVGREAGAGRSLTTNLTFEVGAPPHAASVTAPPPPPPATALAARSSRAPAGPGAPSTAGALQGLAALLLGGVAAGGARMGRRRAPQLH